MTMLWSDIKYGLRMLRKNPGFAAVAILTLALGIGVNTAIFSLLNGVWMRSLPVRDPRQLRVVNWSGHNAALSYYTGGASRQGRDGARIDGSFPYPVYRDFEERIEGCANVFALYSLPALTVVGPDVATTTNGLMVSGGFFDGYGAGALIGRTLVPDDESPEADPVAVITYRWWERQYDLNPQVLGQIVMVNRHPFTIVGVMPRSYRGPEIGDMANIYVPMSAQPQLNPSHSLDARDHWWANIMVRLESDAEESQVQAAMEGIFLQTLDAPGQKTRMDNPHIILEDGSRGLLGMRQRIAMGLFVIMVVTGLVLLIACANLAGLLLARGTARQQELAVRAAMGAGRLRLIRQLFTESLILSLAGAAVGLLLAVWIESVVVSLVPGSLDNFHFDVGIDVRVLSFSLGAAILTSLLFGLLPALRVARPDLCSGLKGHRALGVPGWRLGRALVAAQVSLSVVLLVGAGLLLQTLVNLYRVNVGFNTDRLLVFGVNPRQAGREGADAMQFYDQVQSHIAGLAGVRSVALSSTSLLAGRRASTGFSIPGRVLEGNQRMQADVMDVSESFFRTLGIPLLRGRAFDETDISSQPRVAVVNETFVRAFFSNEDPIGQSFRMETTDYHIVGICGDTKYDRLQRSIEPTVYFSHRQAIPGSVSFQVRTATEPLTLVPAVRRIVADLDRTIPVENVSTQAQLIKESIAPERLFTLLCGAMAALGTLLSCIGLYGLLAFMVTRRTSEIGVRLALGARPRDVAWPVIRSTLWLAGFGLVVGIPIALALTQVFRGLLFGVMPHDAITLVAAVLLIFSVALLAAWLPAHRAARVDPMAALRCE